MTLLHLAVALDGAGWHPAAWREPGAQPLEIFTARYWVDLVRIAEEAALDFVTFECSPSPWFDQRGGVPGQESVPGRLDAVQTAARVAPVTTRIGLVPGVTVMHTEPFHASRALATLDHVSRGRAGWCPRVSGSPEEAALYGRRESTTDTDERVAEASDFAEVVQRLWDSWEDGAEIRDHATGRFLDAAKLHHVDFRGRWFSVRGPSVVSRPSQGQLPTIVAAWDSATLKWAARTAEVVLVPAQDPAEFSATLSVLRQERANTGSTDNALHVFADLTVVLDERADMAEARVRKLDDMSPGHNDGEIIATTPTELADRLIGLHQAGVSGIRLRPAVLPHDLRMICGPLVTELRRRAAFRHVYEADTLRGLLGLSRPPSRYAVLEGGKR